MFKKQKIASVIYVFVLMVSAGFTYASSSSSYTANDENLSFGHNEGYMESSSFALDLSAITWTERYSESGSYTVIDANSDLDLTITPPPPPPTGDGGDGPGGGPPMVDTDVPIIDSISIEEDRELKEEDQIVSEEEEAEAETETETETEKPDEEASIEEEIIEILRPSPEEVEKMIEEDKNIFIFTEKEPIIYYGLDKKYDDYEFIQIEDYEIAPLKLNVPEEVLDSENEIVQIDGETGKGYEVVTLWLDDDYVGQTYVTADENGKFIIKSPDALEDGKYFVFVYGLYREGNLIVQTNYETVKFEVIDGVAYVKYISDEVKKPCFNFDLLFIYIIIILIALYSLWKKKD